MLNNFYFHVYAQKWLFVIMSHVKCRMSHVKFLGWSLGHAEQFLFSCLCSNVDVCGWKWQCLFFYHSSTLSCEWSNHRAGSQLKSIVIFTYKQWLLSIDMKTKVVQHVLRIIYNVFKVFKFSEFSITFKLWNSWFPAFVWSSDIFLLFISINRGKNRWPHLNHCLNKKK